MSIPSEQALWQMGKSADEWLEEHDKQIRKDAIDECIKTLAESEDTILSDRQYYTLMELKGQKNE